MEEVEYSEDIFEGLEDLTQPKTYYQKYFLLSENIKNNFISERFDYLIESLNIAIKYQIYLEKINRINVLYALQLL